MADQRERQPEKEDASGHAKSGPQPHLSPDAASIPTTEQPPPAEQQAEAMQLVYSRLSAESYSGPLPHPDVLAKFNQVVPGAAARILKMAEKQSEHRQALERRVVEGDVRRSWYGLWTGFAIGMTGIIGSVILGIYGHAGVAGVLGAGTLASLVSVFVIGTKSKRDERNEKIKVLMGGSPSVEK